MVTYVGNGLGCKQLHCRGWVMGSGNLATSETVWQIAVHVACIGILPCRDAVGAGSLRQVPFTSLVAAIPNLRRGPTAQQPNPQPVATPGTFHLLIYGR